MPEDQNLNRYKSHLFDHSLSAKGKNEIRINGHFSKRHHLFKLNYAHARVMYEGHTVYLHTHYVIPSECIMFRITHLIMSSNSLTETYHHLFTTCTPWLVAWF